MLESLLGNSTIEKILLFLETYGQGYPKGMSRTFGISVNGIQQPLSLHLFRIKGGESIGKLQTIGDRIVTRP